MSKKHKYVVRLPDGTQATRTSPRTYSHAIAVKDARGWGVLGYAGNLDLANKAFNRATKVMAKHRLIPVDSSDYKHRWTEVRMIVVDGYKPVTEPKPAKAEPVKPAVPTPVLRDERISFGIKWFLTEEDAQAYAKAHSGATYNGGWFHGMSCGRDDSWDMEVKAWHHDRDKLDRSIPIGTKLYAVTD
jgi:hypothetical protein